MRSPDGFAEGAGGGRVAGTQQQIGCAAGSSNMGTCPQPGIVTQRAWSGSWSRRRATPGSSTLSREPKATVTGSPAWTREKERIPPLLKGTGSGPDCGARSDGAHGLGLRALLALTDLELHALSLVEVAEARGVDLGVVHEDVGAGASPESGAVKFEDASRRREQRASSWCWSGGRTSRARPKRAEGQSRCYDRP
jgi:hypothetical protein